MSLTERMKSIWSDLYPGEEELLERFLDELRSHFSATCHAGAAADWYKDAVVYSLYVDLFNGTFRGLVQKLDYLCDLGINCLWLLPVLESPMRDAGFDISDHYHIRKTLCSRDAASPEEEFLQFLKEAHHRDIRVIFDVAVNHTSEEHPWFRASLNPADPVYRGFYHWNNKADRYLNVRVIFKGLEPSNWTQKGDGYYFHRFFHFQPDLNYANPAVLLEMCRILLFWQRQGVDGFRLDAIPYLWKEEGTSCENLPRTHQVIRFFRAVLDLVRPGTLLLAEACQVPGEVVRYFGHGDECHAAYHFPLMPRIFMALSKQNPSPVREILSTEHTPPIESDNQWFTFLRCHDELSLERVYVSEEERSYLHETYCRLPSWDFRQGEGISARLADLMQENPQKILLAFSLLLTLPGSPVIYYGDEFGKTNDENYYRQMTSATGKDDSRFLVRGSVNWEDHPLQHPVEGGWQPTVYAGLRQMLRVRAGHPCFGRGDLQWMDQELTPDPSISLYTRSFRDEQILVVHNLSEHNIPFDLPYGTGRDLLGQPLSNEIPGLSYWWILLNH